MLAATSYSGEVSKLKQNLEQAEEELGRVKKQLEDKQGMQLLGNVVISKKFLRTRKIMVMHSNERGECCPRTLVDR